MRPVRGPRAAALVLALGASLVACSGGGGGAGEPAATSSSPDGGASAEETREPLWPERSGIHAANPVIDDDFPDPDLLEVDGTWYAYATNGNLDNVRVASSTDLVEWTPLDDAMPQMPSWVVPGNTWAPEVTAVGDGYVLYFTARNYDPSVQCIGVATADSPEGPFTAVGDQMLICPQEEGGAIDASTFLDTDGTLYLLWKNDGNCCGLDTWLYAAPLTADGLALAGEPTRLVKQDQAWEAQLVEAPTLVLRDGVYTLFYSANSYGGWAYAVGYATAPAPLGPFTKADAPLLTTQSYPDAAYYGPGGQDVVAGPDGDVIVFHSWDSATTYRAMNVLPLQFADGRPVLVTD